VTEPYYLANEQARVMLPFALANPSQSSVCPRLGTSEYSVWRMYAAPPRAIVTNVGPADMFRLHNSLAAA